MECFSSKLQAVLCAAALLVTGQLCADELDDRVKGVRDAVVTHIQQLRGAARSDPTVHQHALREAEQLEQVLKQLGPAALLRPEFVAQKIEEVRTFSNIPPGLSGLLDELASELPKLAEQRTERQLAEIDRLVNKAASACLSAKAESDLDPLLRELSVAAGRPRGESANSEREQRAHRRLRAAIDTVSRWQDYLAHLALGNPAGASSTLQQLLQSTEYPIIARAEIEKRLLPTGAARDPRSEQLAVIKGVQNIDGLDAALEELRRRLAAEQNASNANVLQPLQQLAAAVAAARAGFVAEAFHAASTSPNFGGPLGSEWDAEVRRLRGLLLLKVLPRYLELREPSGPKEGENVSEYLLRLTEELVKQRRFGEAIRALETYRSVAFPSTTQAPPWIAADLEGLRAFAAAERLTVAGSWAEAINSLRRAAEISGKFTPAKEAAERLAELTAAHPEEAKTAARLAEADAIYQRLSRDIASDAARALEARMPPDIRSRMRPPGYVTP